LILYIPIKNDTHNFSLSYRGGQLAPYYQSRQIEGQTLDELSADYLIVGSGAAGMAFLDVLLSHSDASAIVVDRHHAPGGHWNDAYPFVRLHQPSAYYGVCSQPLGSDKEDTDPLNAGMLERASAAELLAYYDGLMKGYLAGGRVTYLPMAEYHDGREVTMLLSDKAYKINVTKIIDTTFLQTKVPSTHAPLYEVGPGVTCITPNQLPDLKAKASNYTVIGAGKTGVDACLWLLANGVPADRIRWTMPRDGWYQNRANVQRGDVYFQATFGALACQMEAVAEAKDMEALLMQLEADQQLFRIDPNVTPSMYHGAIMSAGELEQLRSIHDVVRKGRIVSLSTDQIILKDGVIDTHADTIYIDCSATGLTKRPPVPVFSDDKVTVQMVKPIQPVFSAALIAFVETLDLSEVDKNALCGPVIVPDLPLDWLHVLSEGLANQARWNQNAQVRAWIVSTRLDTFGKMARSVSATDEAKRALLGRFSAKVGPALINAKRLLRQAALQGAS
jgi:hypothetical protein